MIVYIITNTITQHQYIGKTNNLNKRWYQHKWNAKNGVDTHLYRSIRKYGVEHFTIEVLESQVPVANIDDRERTLIEQYKPHYNMTAGGDGGDTSKSPKFIQAMKKYHSNRTPESYATYGMKGKKLSKACIEAIAKSKHKPTIIEGVEYPSRAAAMKALGISRTQFYRKKYHQP